MQHQGQEEKLWFRIVQWRARFPGESACRLQALGFGNGCCSGPTSFTPSATRRSTRTMPKSATRAVIVAQEQNCGVEQAMIQLTILTQNVPPWQGLEFLRCYACDRRGDLLRPSPLFNSSAQGLVGGSGGTAAFRAASFLR